jgi:hypothetical protein
LVVVIVVLHGVVEPQLQVAEIFYNLNGKRTGVFHRESLRRSRPDDEPVGIPITGRNLTSQEDAGDAGPPGMWV